MDNGISFKEKLSFGIGAYGKDLVYGIVATFVMVYYTDVVQVSPAFVGGLFLVARIWDAINDPMMGLIVDNTHTKYGKFRPWILAGTIINSVVLALLFLNPADFLQGTLVYVWCAVTYILWGMTYTLMDVPYWSMIPSFSSDSKVRDTMSVIPRLFAMFGGSTITTFGLMIIAFLGVNMGGTVSDGYFRFALLIAVVFNICEVICFLFTREHVVTESQERIKPADACDYGEFKTGKRTEAIVFSAQTLSVKFGSAMSGALGGLLLQFVGYVPNIAQTEQTIMGLKFLMFVLSAIIFATMMFIYVKCYKLNGDFYKDMLSMLEITREQKKLEQAQA